MAEPVLSMAIPRESALEAVRDPMIREAAMTVGPVAVLVIVLIAMALKWLNMTENMVKRGDL